MYDRLIDTDRSGFQIDPVSLPLTLRAYIRPFISPFPHLPTNTI